MNYIQSVIDRVSEYYEGIATSKEINRAKRAWKKIIEIRSGKSFVKLEVIISQDMF